MKELCFLIVIALTIVSCNRDPKHIKDIENAQVFVVSHGTEDCYQFVADTVIGLWGLAKMDGSIILPPKYNNIKIYFHPSKRSDDIFFVENAEELWGAYNTSRKKIVNVKYNDIDVRQAINNSDTVCYFCTTLAKQRNYEYEFEAGDKTRTMIDDEVDWLHGILTLDGKELVPCKFGEIDLLGNGFFKVKSPKDESGYFYYGLYKNNKEVIPCEYEQLEISKSFNGALALISRHRSRTGKDSYKFRKWYAFDLTDNCKKTELYYSDVSIRVSDNFIIYKKHDSQARLYYDEVLDFKGNVIIPGGKYTHINENEGFFVCDAGYHDVLLNSSLQKVFGEEYCRLSYSHGVFIVYDRKKEYGTKEGVIDKNGKWILPSIYKKIDICDNKIKAYDYDSGRVVKEIEL